MTNSNIIEHTHRRYNPLADEWVLVSPERGKRPWFGQQETSNTDTLPAYDPHCYLCPGNARINGETNPQYDKPFVFINDFAAIAETTPAGASEHPLFTAKSERGVCKVICFSPRHDLTLPELSSAQAQALVRTWQDQYRQLKALDNINYVQIFENKGAAMGCSNPHPHGQIWAQESVPVIPAKEDLCQKDYFAEHGKVLLHDYLEEELLRGERVVLESDNFLCVVPYWASWPFEVLLLPKRAQSDILAMNSSQLNDFADVIQRLTVKYDNLFQTSFPYSAGIHQSPTNGADAQHWCWHMHFYPPLLRSAHVRKFMVGYEMLAEPQRDITPEHSAKILRELPNIHYKKVNTK